MKYSDRALHKLSLHTGMSEFNDIDLKNATLFTYVDT